MIHVQTAQPQQAAVQFPALMISQDTACLILASAGDAVNLIGVCLHPGASEHHYCDIRMDWPRRQFVPYQLPLVIRNA